MIEIEITNQMRDMAQTKAEEMGKLHNSITGGNGNLAGFLGEAMVANLIGTELINTYNYDIIYLDRIKIDVKTKRTDIRPQPHYECSVADFNTKQDCDWYVFTRILNSCSRGWVLGFLPKKAFYKKSELSSQR